MDLLIVGLLAASVIAFFAGVAIVVANVAGATFGRAGVNRGLHSIDMVYGATTAERQTAAARSSATGSPS